MSQEEVKEQLCKVCVLCGREFPAKVEICPDDNTLLTPIGKEPKVGDIFAERYEILGVIGDGGMGKVYKARHNLMKRVVAIKMLLPHLVQNAAALKRFTQEAQAASALKHPHILYVHDFGISDQGIPYLVMDYLEGINLSTLLQEQGHLPESRAIPIFIQACSALAHAHSKGVIHRDIKPANIMLIDYEGQKDYLQIVDFGIAKLLQPDGAEQLTHTGEVFGSPLYMSPEQCRGKELDPRSDIYSLGCVLYRTLSGRPLFGGRDAMECMYKQVNDSPSTFNDVCPELQISEKLEAAVFKAIAKEPQDRFQDMNEFKTALEGIGRQTSPSVHKIFSVPPQSGQQVAYDAATDQLKRPANLASTQYAGHTHEKPAAVDERAAETPKAEEATATGVDAAASSSSSAADASSAGSPAGDELPAVAPTARPADAAIGSETTVNIAFEAGAVISNPAPNGTSGGSGSRTVVEAEPVPTGAHVPALSKGEGTQQDGGGNTKLIIGGAVGAVLVVGALIIAFAGGGPKNNNADNPSSTVGTPEKGAAKQLVSVAGKQIESGNYKDAESTLKQAAGSASGDEELMEVLPKQAAVFSEADKFSQAEEAWSKLVALQEKHGLSQPEIARSKVELAINMIEEGKIDDAEPILNETQKILTAAPAAQKKGLSHVYYGLSKIAVSKGDYQNAVSYLTQAIDRKNSVGEGIDSDALQYMQDLAVVYTAQGKLGDAEKLLNSVLDISKKKNEGNSIRAADTYKDLGTICFMKNQLGKAGTYFKKSLDLKTEHFGADSVAAAEVMTTLAMTYAREGKINLALPLAQSALDIRSRELGADSPQAKRAKDILAKVQSLVKKGK